MTVRQTVRGRVQLKPSCGDLLIAMNEQFLQNESRSMIQSVIQFHHLNKNTTDFKYLNQVPGPVRRGSVGRGLIERSEPTTLTQNLPNHLPMSLPGPVSPAVTTVTLSHVPPGAIGQLHRGLSPKDRDHSGQRSSWPKESQPKKEKRVRVCGSCNSVCEKHAKAVCEKCFKKYLMF